VTFELKSYRNGMYGANVANWDPRLRLFGTDGVTVLMTVDNLLFRDPTLSFVFTTAATSAPFCTLEVGTGSGTATGDYFLTYSIVDISTATLETEPNQPAPGSFNGPIAYGTVLRPVMSGNSPAHHDYFSFSGIAGDMVSIRRYDNNNFQSSLGVGNGKDISIVIYASDGVTVVPSSQGDNVGIEYIRTILPASGTYFIRCAKSGPGTFPFDYAIVPGLLKAAAFETEPNDTSATAGTLDAGGRASGVISTAANLDIYSLAATAGDLVVISTYAQLRAGTGFLDVGGFGSTLQPLVRILDSDGTTELARARYTPAAGNTFAESVTNALATVEVSFVAATTGTFYIEVGDQGGSASASHMYVIERR